MKIIRVRPHYIHRNGKRIKIRGHTRHVVTSLDKGRTGNRFKALAEQVAEEYMKKGYSRQKALQIGKAVAGKVFWRKYGKVKGSRILRRER